MKKAIISCLALLCFALPSSAQSSIQVEFKPGTSKAMIQTLAKTYGMAYKHQKKNTYQFMVPALRQPLQMTELLAHLTPVQKTIPTYVKKSDGFTSGQLLVKYKSDVSQSQIAAIEKKYGVKLLNMIQGIQVRQLLLPNQMTVNQALGIFQTSGLIEYAEPNYQMSLPTPVSPSNAPISTGVPTLVQVKTHSQVIIDFRPGTSLKDLKLFHQIYGSKELNKRSFSSFLVQLPDTLPAATAERVMRLFPKVIHVQRIQS